MRQAGRINLLKHGIQYAPGDSNHPLPGTSHMGCVRRIEDPCTTFSTKVPLHVRLSRVSKHNFQLLTGSYKIGPTVRTDLFCRSSQSKKPSQGVYKGGRIHAVNQLDVYCTSGHTSEKNSPSFALSLSSSRAPCNNCPRSKNIKTTYVNGGSVLRRSMGRSAIFCSVTFPRSLLHMTHLCRMLLISFLTPTIQYPALRIADSVNTRP